MDFKNTPVECHPAYTWLWNTTATREEVKRQIDEMYESGIRAFYVLGEPERFRPNTRRTHLAPEYLSDEYIDLVLFTSEYAKEKGMYTWLYNEGGFPSGMACGKILDIRPDLVRRDVRGRGYTLKAGTPYEKHADALVSFCDGVRVNDGDIFSEDKLIMDFCGMPAQTDIHTDIARKETAEMFLKLTHEALKKSFGDIMGKDVTMMFDDEAMMGSWSEGLEKRFLEKYGYDLLDYLPYVIDSSKFPPVTEEQRRAKIDYMMLCGDLVRENYFAAMRKWLNENGMLSVGHLDLDHTAMQSRVKKYGNGLKMLREFDVPGIDVIWSQITYPDENGVSCHDRYQIANEFFPRRASSAARQQGHAKCLSESFAVYGAHVTADEMRYAVNYQAVRGISLYNFMVISLDRKGVMCYQYRPNFIAENTGMDCLYEINDYTARLSYILQSGMADITTALYYPQRTVCVGGEYEEEAVSSYMAMGDMLERAGVSFDIIDEDIVLNGRIENGALIYGDIVYKNVFVPTGKYELDEVRERLALICSDIAPCIDRRNEKVIARKIILENGDECYFVTNTDSKALEDVISLRSDKRLYEIDLFDGEIYSIPYTASEGTISVPVKLLRGEGIMLYLTNSDVKPKSREVLEYVTKIDDVTAYINREYSVGDGPVNEYFAANERPIELGEWDKHFSGEATYVFRTEGIEKGDYVLDLGEVKHFAKIYLNGDKIAEKTMFPYRVRLGEVKSGDEIKIIVANTIANVCHDSPLFDRAPKEDVGAYHEKMKLLEEKAAPGGLLGPIRLFRIK